MMLERLARDFARAIEAVDARRPVAKSKRTGRPYQPGIGPHAEKDALRLVVHEAVASAPDWYRCVEEDVRYPTAPRQRCDLSIETPDGALHVEAKLLRMVGDNGKPNDNMLNHILSPYPRQNSALTDCAKLAESCFAGRKGVLIIGYSYPDMDMPLEPAIAAFEALARRTTRLGQRVQAAFSGLCHPVHRSGAVLAWEVLRVVEAG